MIEIVWPQQWAVPVQLIERWFAEAVSKMQIPPGRITAKTPQAMAEALEDIGWIALARQQPVVIPRTGKRIEDHEVRTDQVPRHPIHDDGEPSV